MHRRTDLNPGLRRPKRQGLHLRSPYHNFGDFIADNKHLQCPNILGVTDRDNKSVNMASEEPEADNRTSAEGSGTGSDSNDSSNESEQVETLIAGRARRATAGNRMAKLIEEEEDDEVALLFAEEEGEEDVEFEGDGDDVSDAQMDSDSDEDDHGPNAAADDDMDGEQELQRQAKAERARKRKQQEAMTTLPGLRKKVKIDPKLPTKATAPADPRPKKKSERISWLPNLNEGPVRASSRKQTLANKEVTHARLKDHEIKRRKLAAQMAKARDQEGSKPKKKLTQEDRLAEAARVEKKNLKSLSRWETMEKKRAEEEQARLAALHNRQLEGPVVTFYSGRATWIGDKLVKVGSMDVKQQPKEYTGEKRGRKKKQVEPDANVGESSKEADTEEQVTDMPTLQAITPAGVQSETNDPSTAILHPALQIPSSEQNDLSTAEIQTITNKDEPEQQDKVVTESSNIQEHQKTSDPKEPSTAEQPSHAPETALTKPAYSTPQAPDNFLEGIHEFASLPPEVPNDGSTAAENSAPATSSNLSMLPQSQVSTEPTQVTDTPVVSATTAAPPSFSYVTEIPETGESSNQPSVPPPEPQYSTRNLIILTGFDNLSIEDEQLAQDYSMLMPREKGAKPPKLTKTVPELCVITSKPAKYRDPQTLLPYANVYAYKKIQELKQGKFKWSNMLGCYVGAEGVMAKGVPEHLFTSAPQDEP